MGTEGKMGIMGLFPEIPIIPAFPAFPENSPKKRKPFILKGMVRFVRRFDKVNLGSLESLVNLEMPP